MKVSNNTILKTSYIITVSITIVGVILKLMHNSWTEAMLIAGVISALLFIILAIKEVINSTRIDRNEKIMWILGFVFMNGIAGLIYLLSARKRIVAI